ncbi:MAG: hypothetical protein M3374_04955 [Pseudomonadota bacterium]|nr:hypothetical protein [Pseudomonadota bacterium]
MLANNGRPVPLLATDCTLRITTGSGRISAMITAPAPKAVTPVIHRTQRYGSANPLRLRGG